MKPNFDHSCTAFTGSTQIASGDILDVAVAVKHYRLQQPNATVLIFDDINSQQLEIDFRGEPETVKQRLLEAKQAEAEPPKGGPGRPKLGVIAREVTLLPRHWEWLGQQPGGASAVLRRLVDEARKTNQDKDNLRQIQDSIYRFMTVMAGDLPDYEEALRALYANKAEVVKAYTIPWPQDIRQHIEKLLQPLIANS